MATRPALLLLGLLVVLASGCGGGGGAVSGGTLDLTHDAIERLQNYAFTTRLDVSSPDADLQVTFEGTFQAPDRIQGTISVRGEPYERLLTDLLGQPAEGEVIVIGDRAWWRDADGAWHEARDLSSETQNPLITFRQYATPEFYLEALQFESLLLPVTGESEEVNGVDAIPARLDKEAIVDLLPQATAIKIDPDADEHNPVLPGIIENAQQVLPDSFLVEAWFARNGGYPVRIVFDYEVTEDDNSNLAFGFGPPANIRLQLDITNPQAAREIVAPET